MDDIKSPKKKQKTGRPKLDIDGHQVQALASFHCTDKEIASFFDCHPDTLRSRFSAFLDKGREEGKRRLRKMQWEAAEKGNVVMLIWLGKQYLNQKESPENNDNADKSNVVYESEWGGMFEQSNSNKE